YLSVFFFLNPAVMVPRPCSGRGCIAQDELLGPLISVRVKLGRAGDVRCTTALQLLKRNRRNHEQINRRNPLHMIAKEGLPSLQWPIPSRYHVDGNRGLGDRNAEFEQFAVNLGSAPQRVFGSARAPLGRSAAGPR